MNPQLKPPIRIGPGSKRRHSLELHLQLTLSKRSAIEIDQPMAGQVALLRLEDEPLGILEQDPLPTDRLGVARLASSVKKKERVEKLDLPGSLGEGQPERTPLIGKEHPPRTGTHEATAPGDLDLGFVQKGMIINPGPDSQRRMGQPPSIGSQDRQGDRQRTANIELDAVAGPRPAAAPTENDQVGRIPRALGLRPAAAGILAAMQDADLGRIPGMVDLDMRPQARVFGVNLGKPEASIAGRLANHRSQRREACPRKRCRTVKPAQPHIRTSHRVAADGIKNETPGRVCLIAISSNSSLAKGGNRSINCSRRDRPSVLPARAAHGRDRIPCQRRSGCLPGSSRSGCRTASRNTDRSVLGIAGARIVISRAEEERRADEEGKQKQREH